MMKTLQPAQDYRSNAKDSLHQDIVRYYDESYWDYRTSWLNPDNLAIHYGYWDRTTRSHSDALVNMNRTLAEAAEIQPGARVLDAGCGVGGSAIWLGERLGAHVTGITLSASQARLAERNARRRGVNNLVDFQVMDFCHTSFPDRSFDVIWGIESVCHALDKREFLAEAFRLLRPGGLLVCADGYARKARYSAAEWRHIEICLNGWQIPNLSRPEEFQQSLRDTGFTGIRFTDATSNIMPSARRLRRIALWTYPMQKVMAWLRLRTAAQSGNFYTAMHQFHIFNEGLACYGIVVAEKPEVGSDA
jgi:cyclopropane fatty-acyl-phospholipid synthase-like methyltransferase